MNPYSLVVGIAACAYAAFVLVMRLRGRDDKFRKLGPMREFWGPRLGSAIHYVGYVVIPLVFGIFLIVAGLRGKNVFSAFE
jgi:hypothetical protein